MTDITELAEARKMYGMIRPIHKRNLAIARLNAEKDKKHPEPMSLFRKRERDKEIPEVAQPKGLATLGAIEKAAVAMAEWDKNDPFIYDRTALYVKQGYLRSEEVVKEMTMRTIARKAARVKEVDDAKIAG